MPVGEMGRLISRLDRNERQHLISLLGPRDAGELLQRIGMPQAAALLDELWAVQATDAFLKVSGLVGGEELRTMPLHTRSMRRLAWLTINIGLNIAAASVIALNQHVLEEVIALASSPTLTTVTDMCGFFLALTFAYSPRS